MNTKHLTNLINKHKLSLSIGFVLLLLFMIFSVTRCSQVHENDGAESESAAEYAESAEGQAVEKLSDDQREKQDNYEIDISNILDVLKANLWGTEKKDHLVAFSDKAMTLRTSSGNSETIAFVVDAIKDDKTSDQSDKSTTTTYQIAIETSDSSGFLTLRKTEYGNGSMQYFLRSDDFLGSQEDFSPVSAADSIQVTNLNSDLLQIIDNKKSELEKAVKTYCSQYHPAATNISWSKYVQIDWDTNTVSIPFDLDETGSEQIYVEYDRAKKSFSVMDSKDFSIRSN